MFKFSDFYHLPQVDKLIEQLSACTSGLIVVAGLDTVSNARPAEGHGFLPSGRGTVFHTLLEVLLNARTDGKIAIVTRNPDLVRIPWRKRGERIAIHKVEPPFTSPELIARVIQSHPVLLVIDKLDEETAGIALQAAAQGTLVFSQLDTLLRGPGVMHQLVKLGADARYAKGLAWTVAVQRMAALCPDCKQPVRLEKGELEHLRQRFPYFDWVDFLSAPNIGSGEKDRESLNQYLAPGCAACDTSGRKGDVAVFDLFKSDPEASDFYGQTSRLPADQYILQLALLGYLTLKDCLDYEIDQLRRAFSLFEENRAALEKANAALERKLTENEAANRVLQQRTRALVSLQEMGTALISSTDMEDLAVRITRHTCDLCGADRAILYFLSTPDVAEVLAVEGWDPAILHTQVNTNRFSTGRPTSDPVPYSLLPPGVPKEKTEQSGKSLRTGLLVPLVAQRKRVGLMAIHSTKKAAFAPGEVALLQTFANQAALAIQRARLVDDLRSKIEELEAAQVGLAQKERLEHELELARQVQQSILPRKFPIIPGYNFAASYEPARQVGGDFYDVIDLDEDHYGVAIADVSDKGMPAALFMTLARSLLLAEARRELSPRAVLAQLNRLLLELGDRTMFVTLFYGVVERSSRRLTFARAGHDRPLLLRGKGLLELGGKGTALGILDEGDFTLSEEQLELVPGDCLVLYTDGLVDILTSDGSLLEQDHLKNLLLASRSLSPDELCTFVFKELTGQRGSSDQFDDMAMLVVQVAPHENLSIERG